MHSSLDQLASDAEVDEIFVHAHIYRHTPTANLFHKAFTQFEGGGFDLGSMPFSVELDIKGSGGLARCSWAQPAPAGCLANA
jgi:hypothetical protein